MMPMGRWPAFPKMALAALLGALGAFGLAPFDVWPATLVSLVLVGALFQTAETRRRAGWIGWAFAAGYFAHALAWITEPFQVDAARHAWMAPFALFFMASGLALFWVPAFWVSRDTRLTPLAQGGLLAVAVALVEFARGYVLTGFPWAGLAQIWTETPVSQLLSLAGPYALAALTLLVTLPLGTVLGGRARWRDLAVPAGLAVGFLGLAAGYGLSRPPAVASDKIVRLVQPNAPQHQKWDPEFAPVFFARQLEFTLAEPRPDLIVWPETSVPAWLGSAQPFVAAMADAARGIPVVFGIQRGDGPRIYNSLVVLDDQGRQAGVYDKHHLAPFGEYVPFGEVMARFGIHGLAATTGNGFSAGPGAQVLPVGTLGKALPLICYEAVFTQDVLATPERPDFLLQITNDAWFGTRSGPYQHLAQARMRAIEQGLPMMRSANTGVSAMIDPLGRVSKALPLGTAGYVDAPLFLPHPATVYSRMGDVPVLVLLLAVFVLFLRNARRSNV